DTSPGDDHISNTTSGGDYISTTTPGDDHISHTNSDGDHISTTTPGDDHISDDHISDGISGGEKPRRIYTSIISIASLHAIQVALNEVPVAPKQAKHHRWLSHENAVKSVVRSYRCIVADLEAGEVAKDPQGNGLLKTLKKT
ncbi:hypothetical protein MAR_000236, partial [Mya arenaria]